uniref:DUF4340 domain-containing protein n=1 Tax=Candidatus Kentrum sp. DK TaxID=2126562 RepID=A0A450TBP2_9GAMM|nr:MAG: protein of unknown function (DUF4340) [Candidatus Kentron sp. DK]
MRGSRIFLLALATVLAVSATFYIQQKPGGTDIEHDTFFPALAGQLTQVARLQISKGDSSVTLHRQKEDSWRVQERAGYPADLAKVHELLLGSARLQRRELKTRNPKHYAHLGVSEMGGDTGEGESATRISLRDGEGETLADFFLGKRATARGRSALEEMYVRVQDDPTVWLVEGHLPRGDSITDWLEKEILVLEPGRIQKVRITHANGETFILEKDSRDAFDYHIAGLPEGTKPKSTYAVNSIPIGMANLKLQDVRKEQEIDLSAKKAGASVVITTFDGMRVTMKTWLSGEDILARFDADFDANAVREPDPGEKGETEIPVTGTSSGKSLVGTIGIRSPDIGAGSIGDIGVRAVPGAIGAGPGREPVTEPVTNGAAKTEPGTVKEQIRLLAERWRGWLYILPRYRMDKLIGRREDLILPTPQKRRNETSCMQNSNCAP